MKIKYIKFVLIPALGLFLACSNTEHKAEEKIETKVEIAVVEEENVLEPIFELEEGETIYNTEDSIEEGGIIGIAKNSSVVNWTSYKTSEKKPVGGTFDEVVIGGISESDILTTAFTGATVSILVKSINSKNVVRDEKLVRAFFGAMANTEVITGNIIEFTENKEVVIEFVMNEVSHKVNCVYGVNKELFTMEGVIDLAAFGAENAVNNLNAECKELHTGSDGVSKTWNEVAIKYTGTLTKR